MGTFIDVWISHELADWRDTRATLDRLRATEPACRAVADYWRSVQPHDRDRDQWVFDREGPATNYRGPGSLKVTVMPLMANLRAGGRWRGFLSIEPLRRVHLVAFHAIAAALGSRIMGISHDSIEGVSDLFFEGGSQVDVLAAIQERLGPPQPSIESIAPWIREATEHGVPDVWFREAVMSPPDGP